ncbi:MAG TPA: alpha/beta hydrolase [Leptolyngbyaceae cyanobacterium]
MNTYYSKLQKPPTACQNGNHVSLSITSKTSNNKQNKGRHFFAKIGKKTKWLGILIGCSGFWLFPHLITAIPAFSAEQIAVFYGPLEFSLTVQDLELFAKEGKISEELATYAGSINPKNLAQLREVLQERFEANPTLVSQFSKSDMGGVVLERLGRLLQTETGENGAEALRGALVSAASDPQGLTLLNLLSKFPNRTIRVNLNLALQMVDRFSKLSKERDVITKVIEQQAVTENNSATKVNFSQQGDLRQPGSFRWDKQTITLNDTARNRSLMVDVYLPQLNDGESTQQPPPLILISHGAAGDRANFAYLGAHLASYGFAVAVLEHPGDNSKLFQQFFSGLSDSPQPIELINRPLESKFVLDELARLEKTEPAWKGRLNTEQVGVIGHSIGGYTGLTLAGAKINFEQVKKDCNDNQFLNLSLFVQCDAGRVTASDYKFQDDRIKALLAINPLTSTIFGENGLSGIKIPVMFIASGNDIFTPAVPEQIRPFTWLTTPNKYLVYIEKATHFSFTAANPERPNVMPIPADFIGPDPALARPSLNALSTAFFQTHLANQLGYQSYLSEGYVESIRQEPFKTFMVQSLTVTQIDKAVESTNPTTTKRIQR